MESWQKLVTIAGGEIEVRKSCISVMSWIKKQGKEVMASVDESPGSFYLTSSKYVGLKKELKRIEPTKGERILGVRVALAGNDDDEHKYRLEQSKELAKNITLYPFSRLDAEIIYRKRWVNSVGYCLPVT